MHSSFQWFVNYSNTIISAPYISTAILGVLGLMDFTIFKLRLLEEGFEWHRPCKTTFLSTTRRIQMINKNCKKLIELADNKGEKTTAYILHMQVNLYISLLNNRIRNEESSELSNKLN